MTTAQKAALAALLALGLLGSAWVARGRLAVERSNRTVALCLDDLEVRQVAALLGQEPAALLKQFKAAGITHVAVSEQTLGDLLQKGAVQARTVGQAVLLQPPTNQAAQFGAALSGKLPAAGVPVTSDAFPTIAAPAVATTMQYLGVGYSPEALDVIRQAGLGVVARPMPDYLYTTQAVEASLAQAKAAGAKTVLFNGVSVAGGTKLAKVTAASLQRLGLQYGFVELVPQEGAQALASALGYEIIRTHSISQEEMTKTSPSRGLDRFTLAVTERNIRLCYIRLLLSPQPDLLRNNLSYITSISSALRASGYSFGEPRPFAHYALGKRALVLLACGLVGGVLWLLQVVLGLPRRWFWGLLVAGVLVGAGGSFAAFGLMRTFVSLFSAIVFPSLAVLQMAAVAGGGNAPARNPLLRAGLLTIAAAGLTALGGLLVAGSLSSSDYMMQIAQFRGVKLAQLLPLVIVLAVSLGTTCAPADAKGWAGLRQGWLLAAEAVVRYWHAVAIFLALGAVGFMLMRSGNESAVEVSGAELKLRALLDQVLLVRPRTKEFIIGYPALLTGLMLLLSCRRRSAWVWLTLGTIGVLSATNTFCHLHTPLPVSLLRIANGLWVGLLVGILWFAAKWVGERVLRRIWWNSDI